MTLTQARVRELFDYHEDGYLIWKVRTSNRIHIGDVAGNFNPTYGYHQVKVDGKFCLLHRVIFLWHRGYMPPHVDHRDEDRQNNRIANLREATKSQNGCNRGKSITNKSGFKGVCWAKQAGKWKAQITAGGRLINIGFFISPEEACEAYCAYAKQLHGDFVNLG